jgi:hypothetical protein
LIEVLKIAFFSGIGAGTVAILATIAIERLGGRLGGVIGTLPTTIIPASWGLWYQAIGNTKDTLGHSEITFEHFSAAMYAVPAGMCLNALFLWLWRIIPQRYQWVNKWSETDESGLFKAVGLMSLITLGLWSICAMIWVLISQHILHSTAERLASGVISLILIITIGVWATRDSYLAPKGNNKVGVSTLLSRGLCAALAVSIAVLISKSGASTLAGVAAVFPAIFWTTMVSLWLTQGQAVPSGAVGPMMLGSSSVAVFALSAPSIYVYVGPLIGSVVAWGLAAALASIPSYLWVSRGAMSRD